MKYIYTYLVLISLFCFACDANFLEQPPRGSLTVGSFPITESDALLATNACYNILRTWQINTGGFPLFDIMADDALKGTSPGDGTAIAPYDNFTHNASEGSVERWYKTMYEAIRRTNLVINDVPLITMDETLKNRYVAEARFLRAFFYFDLVKGFGGVPKVTTIEPPFDLGRSDVDEILNDIIIPDLEYASTFLPLRSQYSDDEIGRITKGAAMSLLARVYLFFGNYDDVLELTTDIIESNEYDLVPSFDQLFLESNEHNEESIFEIGSSFGNFVDGGNQYGNTQGVRGSPNKGWGFCRPAYSLVLGYQENMDPRMEPSILFLNEEIDGETIAGDSSTPDTIRENGQIIEIECYNQKVWVPGNDSRFSFAHNRRIIRYADILLMHAEALNETGQSGDALLYLNKIRERARGNEQVLPDITTTNKEEILDAILDERKYEFALEGLRFHDLVRTGKAEEILGPLGFISGKNELLPIPQSEIDISQGRITQNPGY